MKNTFFFFLAVGTAFVLGYVFGQKVIKERFPEFQEDYEF